MTALPIEERKPSACPGPHNGLPQYPSLGSSHCRAVQSFPGNLQAAQADRTLSWAQGSCARRSHELHHTSSTHSSPPQTAGGKEQGFSAQVAAAELLLKNWAKSSASTILRAGCPLELLFYSFQFTAHHRQFSHHPAPPCSCCQRTYITPSSYGII